MTFYQTLLVASIPAIIGALITYLKLRQDFNLYKTEAMAERAATRLLKHKTFTDRSFQAIQNSLGGWDEDPDKLRQILVRAGAVRTLTKGEEKWHLLSRNKERIRNWEEKKNKKSKQ